jgi:hypothetical protein
MSKHAAGFIDAMDCLPVSKGWGRGRNRPTKSSWMAISDCADVIYDEELSAVRAKLKRAGAILPDVSGAGRRNSGSDRGRLSASSLNLLLPIALRKENEVTFRYVPC